MPSKQVVHPGRGLAGGWCDPSPIAEEPPGMNGHKNARTTPFGRAVMIRRVLEEGWSVTTVDASFEVSTRTVRKWLPRFRREGRPAWRIVARRLTWSPTSCQRPGLTMIARLRREDRMSGEEIALRLRLPRSTVASHLRRLGLGSLGRTRAERADAALRPRTRRRVRPPRCQVARPLPPHRTQDHRRSPPGPGGCRVGVRPRRGRRRLAPGGRRGPAG